MESGSLPGILLNMLNSDNSTRQASEALYKNLVESDPADVTLNLIQIMNSQTDTSLVTLSCILLKRNFECFWKTFTPSMQKSIQRLVLEGLQTISLKFSKIFSEVLSRLAIVIKQHSGKWPEFVQSLCNSLNGKSFQITTGFRVLLETFAFYSEDLSISKERLFQVFFHNFFSSEDDLKTSCCLCFLQVISVLSTVETKYFIGLLQSLLKSIISIESNDLCEKVLESLRDLSETEPLFFKNKLLWCFEFVERLLNSSKNVPCKYLALEFVTVLTEEYPSQITSNQQMVFGMIGLFRIMLEQVIGRPEDQIEINYEKNTLKLVSRVVLALRGSFAKAILDYLEKTLENSIKFKYVSIVLLSETAGEVFGTQLFEVLVNHLKSQLMQTAEEIHLAVIRVFKTLIKKFQMKFLIKNCLTVEEAVIIGFASQHAQIQLEAVELLTELLKTLENQDLQPESKECFLPKLLNFLKTESLVDSVLKCIEASADYFKRSNPLLFDFFYSELCSVFSSVQSPTTKILSMNTLIALRKTVNKKVLKTRLPHLFLMLKSLSEADFSSQIFKSCVLDSWKSLARHFESDFSLYLGEIVPVLLMYVSTEREDIEEYLETLLVIIETTQESFIAYLNTTSKIIIEIIVNDVSDAARSLACSISAVLVEIVLKTCNNEAKEGVIKFVRQFFVAICQVCAYEQDVATLVEMLQSLQRIISAPVQPFLSKSEIEILGDILVQFFHSRSSTNQLRQSASQVLSSMFRSHSTSTAQILDFISMSLLDKYLTETSNNTDKVFALSIFGDILSVAGNIMISEKLESLICLLLAHLNSNDTQVQIQAVKAIIEGTKTLESSKFKDFAEKVFTGMEFIVQTTGNDRSKRKVVQWALAAVCFLALFHQEALRVEGILRWLARFLPVFKINAAEKANEVFVNFVANQFQELLIDFEVFNAILRIGASGCCSKAVHEKIKSCVEGFLRIYGIQEAFKVVRVENHQYLNKLLQ
jgi:hypothetical protein